MAVIPQPWPLNVPVGEFALLDDVSLLIVDVEINQMAVARIGGKKIVAVVEIKRVEIPLHRRSLRDIPDKLGAWRHGHRREENCREVPHEQHANNRAHDGWRPAGASRRTRLTLRRIWARFS